MHRTRNADHAGAAPAGGSFSDGGRDVTASIRSCEDRRAGAAPVGLPISQNARDAEIVEAAACKPALTRCKSGRALHFGAIVQQQDDAMALRRSGCDSPWLHHFFGHEEDSNPRRSDRRDTRGSTEVPDHFKLRQSVGSDARRWYRRETGATPVGGSFCPVDQQLERPALTREVDGANPSGAATFWKSKRTSAPPPVGNRTELQPQLVEHVH